MLSPSQRATDLAVHACLIIFFIKLGILVRWYSPEFSLLLYVVCVSWVSQLWLGLSFQSYESKNFYVWFLQMDLTSSSPVPSRAHSVAASNLSTFKASRTLAEGADETTPQATRRRFSNYDASPNEPCWLSEINETLPITSMATNVEASSIIAAVAKSNKSAKMPTTFKHFRQTPLTIARTEERSSDKGWCHRIHF